MVAGSTRIGRLDGSPRLYNACVIVVFCCNRGPLEEAVGSAQKINPDSDRHVLVLQVVANDGIAPNNS